MAQRLITLLVLLLIAGPCWPNTFTVRNTNDSGPGSLRSAITKANTNTGPDDIVFRPGLAGRVIRPTTMLPAIADDRTSINGDIDGDGTPDIGLDGSLQSSGRLIDVSIADNCTIAGLAITRSPGRGISAYDSDYLTIRSCHVGVNLAGRKAARNADSDIYLTTLSHATVGGASPADRNLIAGGDPAVQSSGLEIDGCTDSTVAGNYFGLMRNGAKVLGGGYCGITISPGARYTIGGTSAGERNLFGGLQHGIVLTSVSDTTISGNYFGLAADGSTGLPIGGYCIWVLEYCKTNVIGGTTSGARNVFAGNALKGVYFEQGENEDNKVQGNYFGCNAAGTSQRRIGPCVSIEFDAGRQIIGGNRARAGNYFTPKSIHATFGVGVSGDASGTLIRHNTFGKLPNGHFASAAIGTGVSLMGVTAHVLDNTFAKAGYGLNVEGSPTTNPRVFRNTFLRCNVGVWIEPDARCRLGNLSNTSTRDDGGNRFRSTRTWHVQNDSGNRIRAEGNSFGTTSRAAIDAKIWDRRDDPSLGRVDFNPLAGGITPTGTPDPVLALTGTAAVATRGGGAEITFTLSAPADVTVDVLNIAGRPVATVARGAATQGGTQHLIWSGQTRHGTVAPAGAYLVRATARDAGGQRAQALSVLRLGR